MACVYRSVSLQAGESYVLPAGAELVGLDGSITSDANCAPTDNLEELGCYVAMIGGYDQGDPTDYWETPRNTYVIGARFNGVDISFSTPFQGQGLGSSAGCYDANGISLAIANVVSGIIPLAGVQDAINDGGRASCTTAVVIRTIPSLAENLFIIMHASLPKDWNATVIAHIPFISYDDAVAAGYRVVSVCDTTPLDVSSVIGFYTTTTTTVAP